MLDATVAWMCVYFTHYGASYHTPCPSLPYSTVYYTRRGNEHYFEADSKRLRNGESMQNIRPAPNGTSRSAAICHGTKQLRTSKPIQSTCAMTANSCSPLQLEKRKPCWLPVKREGWGVHAHNPRRWMSSLHVGHVGPGSSIAFRRGFHNNSVDWPWVDSKSRFVGNGSGEIVDSSRRSQREKFTPNNLSDLCPSPFMPSDKRR